MATTEQNPVVVAVASNAVVAYSRWDRFLDFANDQYDVLRRGVHSYLEYGYRRIRHAIDSRHKERMDASWRAEAERKNTDFEPPLNPDRSLSFFDEYEVINGSPVFTLNAIDARIHRPPHQLDASAYILSRQLSEAIPALRPTLQRQEGFRMDDLKITCYVFSHDDRYIANGMNDGSISVWDAGMGKIVWTLADLHYHPVADVAFLASTNELTLVSVDVEGLCVRWTLRESGISSSQMYCSTSWEDSGYVGTEQAMPRLSSSGDFVCIPIYTYAEPGSQREVGLTDGDSRSEREPANAAQLFCIAFVFSTRMMMMGKTQPSLTLPVKISEPWVGAERLVDLVEFSRKSKALLLTVYENSVGYMVLWPYIRSLDVSSFQLHGTRGSFSPDDAYLVTWHCMLSSEKQYQDSHCYVWDIDRLSGDGVESERQQWNHPNRKVLPHIILGDPNHGVIHTCDFIRIKERMGLVSCCVSDKLTMIIWDLKTETPLHELKTDIIKAEICPAFLRTLGGSLRLMDRIHGTRCLAVSRDRQWVGVYSSTSHKGVVWKVSEGVEVLRINIPEDKLDCRSGMDLTFSRYSDRILMVGHQEMLLWTPSVLRGFNPSDRPVYQLNSADDEVSNGYNICRFSAYNDTVGLMRFNAEVISIWRLDVEHRVQLIRPSNDQIVWRFGQPQGALPNEATAFSNFAISPDGRNVVTSMMDHSVLLWDMGDVNVCQCISQYFPHQSASLDLCFSHDDHRQPTIVVCQDHGILLWMSLLTFDVTYTPLDQNIRSCKFDQQGLVAVIMLDMFRVDVWDIVHRTFHRRLVYQIPMVTCADSGYGPKLSENGEFCLVGFRQDGQPVIASEETTMEELGETIYYPDNFTLSSDGRWALMCGRIDKETDDILMVERPLPNFKDEGPIDQQVMPGIDFRAQACTCASRRFKSSHSGYRTWKIVHLDGQLKSKQMRLPYKLRPSKFMMMTIDGRRCAALNDKQQLIVWGTHFTYKTILQQRHELMEGYQSLTRENIEAKLMEYGPSLTNHPYEKGMNLTVECIHNGNQTLLRQVIDWALKSGSKLSFEGRITFGQELLPNVIDLAVGRRCQQTIELLLQSMLDGVTSVTTMAQILDRSLVKLFYKYKSLVLKFFKNEKLLRSMGVVHVSEQFLKDRKDYMGVTTNGRMIASEDYIQNLWSGNEKGTMKMQPEIQIDVEAEAKVIPFPNIAKMGNEGILQPLLLYTAPHFFFGTELVKGVINYKYKTYGRRLLLEDFYHYLILLLVFTASAIYAGYEQSFGKEAGNILTTVLVVIVASGNLLHFMKQCHSLWAEAGTVGLLHYMKDYMKLIELTSYILVVFFFPICVWSTFAKNKSNNDKDQDNDSDDEKNDIVLGMMAVVSVLLWVKLLYYMQAFESTGGMVVMIRETVKDIRWFLLLLCAILVGFAVAFFVLLGGRMKDENDPNNESGRGDFFFSSLFTTMMSIFLLTLSDAGDIAVDIHNAHVKKETRILAFIMLVAFLAAVAIVLLNLLIAIMGDSFDRVKNHETTFFLQRRAEVILDMEMGLSRERRREINEKIERYLHILLPRFLPSVDDWAWEGRIVDLQKRMQMELRRVSDKEQQGIGELREMITELKELVDARIGSSSRLGGSTSYSGESAS